MASGMSDVMGPLAVKPNGVSEKGWTEGRTQPVLYVTFRGRSEEEPGSDVFWGDTIVGKEEAKLTE